MTDQAIDILNHLSLGIVLADVDGNAVLVNKAGKSMLAACGGSVPAPPETRLHEYRVDQNGRTIEITVSPVENNALFTLKDVTKSIRMEALEKRREKYAAMGELSADIAHEIRNPLGSIELIASLLKRELKKKKDIRRVDQIISSVKAVNSKISRLVLFSQTCEFPPDYVNIHDILEEILHYSEQVIDRDMIYLSIRTADMTPFIEGNPDMLRQIFLSLILIALQSLPGSSRLDIETVYIQETSFIEVHFRAAGRDFLARVSGTDANAGMGLAIIHHIMNIHRGSVRIEQSSRENTAFILSFPLIKDKDINPFEGKP
ncbi:MAG: histidine kinase dimerization/phospho-acceptor domain-containing protein [Pseudomonadota bacterium]